MVIWLWWVQWWNMKGVQWLLCIFVWKWEEVGVTGAPHNCPIQDAKESPVEKSRSKPVLCILISLIRNFISLPCAMEQKWKSVRLLGFSFLNKGSKCHLVLPLSPLWLKRGHNAWSSGIRGQAKYAKNDRAESPDNWCFIKILVVEWSHLDVLVFCCHC